MTVRWPEELSEPGLLAVRTRSVMKRYGGISALAGVNLAVPEGSVYVLVGQNGAGKSTALRVLLDVVVPDSGSAEVFGFDTRREGARVRAQIGYVPERDDAAYGWIRVDRLLRYHAAFYPAWDAAYASELARLFEVRLDARMARQSKGQQRRVQLLLALAHRPPLLLLDEPLDGLDPLMREQALAALAGHLARFPTTILMSTHQVHETERLADHLAVMRAGRLEAQLSRDALRRSLHRYHVTVPESWSGVFELRERVLRRTGSRRELALTVWGSEREVVERLQATGAVIQQVEPLSLGDATVALLTDPAAEDTGESTPRYTTANI